MYLQYSIICVYINYTSILSHTLWIYTIFPYIIYIYYYLYITFLYGFSHGRLVRSPVTSPRSSWRTPSLKAPRPRSIVAFAARRREPAGGNADPVPRLPVIARLK